MEPTATQSTNVPTRSAHGPTAEHPADRLRIVSTPGICGGRPRIDGHRIQVDAVAIDGRWNADVRLRRLFTEDKPQLEHVTCRKLRLNEIRRELSSAAFRRPTAQASLF